MPIWLQVLSGTCLIVVSVMVASSLNAYRDIQLRMLRLMERREVADGERENHLLLDVTQRLAGVSQDQDSNARSVSRMNQDLDRTLHRMEEREAVIAADLAGSQHRAEGVRDNGGEAGEAADEASVPPPPRKDT